MEQRVKSNEPVVNDYAINTRLLMASSAVFMGVLGLSASFFANEIGSYLDLPVNNTSVLFLQITGALYLGFAIMNWMARGNIIGGIYSRPVALGNFLHFLMIALALLKYLFTHPITITFTIGTVLYSAFALGFGYILFGRGKACK